MKTYLDNFELMTKDNYKANPERFHRITQAIYDCEGIRRRKMIEQTDENKQIVALIKSLQTETNIKKFFNVI